MSKTTTHMDAVDRAIINRIQSDFPIASRPYRKIARELQLEEKDVIARLQRLKQEGIIRRIGGNFSPEKVGFVSTLCAAKVPAEKIEQFTKIVNAYPGVTHNYQRENTYNIWFTFICPSMDEIERNLKAIAQISGVSDILNLPATHVFKIKAQFDV